MAGITKKQIQSLVAEAYDNAMNEYVDIIVRIANDIYDSCIEQYYATYKPKVYRRHRDIEGFNLYRANSFPDPEEFNGTVLNDFDGGYPENLLKYGAREDIREEVLKAVLSGKRGITPRPSGWPKNWIASYPNEYSQYNYWSSNFHTMNEIIADFEANIIEDTKKLKSKLFDKYI
jgi:hypothetical protein